MCGWRWLEWFEIICCFESQLNTNNAARGLAIWRAPLLKQITNEHKIKQDMNLCTKLLDSCLNANCDNPIFQGVDAVAYIFNHSEVESLTYDQTNPNLVTAINMKENEGVAYTGYKINQFGKTPYTGTTTTMTEGNIFNRYDSEFHFIVPDNSPTSAKLIDALKDGKFVVVIKNEYEGTDGKGTFQIYGGKKGLVASAIEGAKYSDDTEGGWAITLTETGSPVSALFLEHTSGSGADTETYLEGLVACE